MEIQDKVFSGIFWKLAERLLAQGVSFVVSIILARILLPEAYGIVAMVMVFINIANVFVTAGLGTALIQKKEATQEDFSTVFYCSLGLAVILYILLFLFAPCVARFYRTPQLTPILRVFGIKLLITSYNSIQHAYVQKYMLFRKFFFSTLVGTVVSGMVGIALAIYGAGVWALVAQYLMNALMDTLILSFTISWHPCLQFSPKSAVQLLRFSWKLLAANLIGTVYYNLRSLLIGRLYTAEDLAYYNRGKNFPDLVVTNVSASITAVLFPAMATADKDVGTIKRMVRRALRVTSYILFPMMTGLAMVAKPFVLVLLTDKWLDSVVFLQLVCISGALHTISDANLQAMNAMGRSDLVLKLEFIKKPVGLALILGLMRWGVLGIGISLPLASAFSMLVNMWPNKKLLGYGMREQVFDLLPAAGLSALMAVGVWPIAFMPISSLAMLLLQIVVGVGIYMCASYIFKNDSYLYLTKYVRKRMVLL